MATQVNLLIDQGATFSTVIDLVDENGVPINLSSYTGASQLRRHYTSSNAINFTVALTSNGVVTLSLTANQTTSLTAGRYLYDVEVTDNSGIVSRIVEGIVSVTPNVTR
jgi:hypothetical protein